MEIRENTEQNNETVHSMIRQHNAKFMTEFQDYSYHIEEEGGLVAGIVAEAVFDTVEVEFLCVKESCRGKGYGRALLQYVEEQAENDGRKRILLNTYSFQAPEFYRSLGYEERGGEDGGSGKPQHHALRARHHLWLQPSGGGYDRYH